MEDHNAGISHDQVRKQLKILLHSGELKNAIVLSQFLEYVVEQKLEGAESKLKEYNIAVHALGKPPDFSPQVDATVRIHAGRLRRCLKEYYTGVGKNDPVIISIPKGSYIPSFELAIHQNDSETSTTANSPEPAIIKQVSDDGLGNEENDASNTHAQVKRPVMAVFPFQNFSADGSKDYFVNGMGEQLSIELARFQNISVISYYSTWKYDASALNLKALQNKIGLDYVLTGSVRFTEDVVRLNIQLLLTDDSRIVWAETYIRQLSSENLYEIQEDISDQVLNIIAGDDGIVNYKHLAGSSPFPRSSIAVRDAIYKYYHFVHRYDPDTYKMTVASLENAVKQEPENALASAMLADLYLHTYVNAITPATEIFALANDLAEKAVKTDPHCQHAHKAFAWCQLLKGNKTEAIEAAEYCISLNPRSVSMISAMGIALISLGEFSKGFNSLVKTMQLSPELISSAKLGFALYYFARKNYSESKSWLEKSKLPMIPFIISLNIALQGKLNQKKVDKQTDDHASVLEHAEEIISKFIIDESLREEILDGIRLSGVLVKTS